MATVKVRENALGRAIDLTAEDGQGNPYPIGSNRAKVVVADKNERVQKVYDSNQDHIRMAVEPDDGNGPQTGVVRVWPDRDVFRKPWSPYTAFIWVYESQGFPLDFPGDQAGHTIEVLPSYGTGIT